MFMSPIGPRRAGDAPRAPRGCHISDDAPRARRTSGHYAPRGGGDSGKAAWHPVCRGGLFSSGRIAIDEAAALEIQCKLKQN